MDAVDLDARSLRRYPHDCVGSVAVVADAVEYIENEGHRYAFRHASPPCQAYSVTRHSHGREHPELIEPTRAALVAVGGPYVIENVEGARAHLLDPLTLCGASFGLTATDKDGSALVLRRHRLFESNVWMLVPECLCATYRRQGYKVAGVYGGGSTDRNHAEQVRRGGYTPSTTVQGQLLGIDWMTKHGQNQSIPPVYTEWLGLALLEALPLWDAA